MLFRCLIALLIVAGIRANDHALIPLGAEWQYWIGAQAPGANWNQLEADTENWKSGPAGFSAGFGFYNEATILPWSFDSTSVYFRREFDIADLDEIQWLVLRLHYADGFAAYLNGTEVARGNVGGVAGEPAPFDALALKPQGRDVGWEFDLTPHLGLLEEGMNLLAIQVLKSTRDDLTVCFNPELLKNFIRGPIVAEAIGSRAVLHWKTLIAVEAEVTLRTPDNDLHHIESGSGTNHVIEFTQLQEGLPYEYQVRLRGEGKEATSPWRVFRTLPQEGPVSFLALGDSGTGSLAQLNIAAAMKRTGADFVLHAGDIAYPSFIFGNVDSRVYSVYQPQMASTPYFFCIGNHDLYSGEAPYLESLYLPVNNAAGTEHYYSFDAGDAHIVSVLVPYLSQYTPLPGDEQMVWLDQDLSQTDKPWKILLFHNPLETSGLHRWDDYNFNGKEDRLEIQEALLPIIEKHGVQLVINGHDHNYERLMPMKGAHPIVTAGGGVGLYRLGERDPLSARFYLRHHFVRVQLDEFVLRLDALDENGDSFDQMVIYRSGAEISKVAAAWGSPRMGGSADDGDYNMTGEEFDFTGTLIPTIAGQWSNLGEARVMNDESYLHLGFEKVMLPPAANLLAFIGTTATIQAFSVAELGNGVFDPEVEGLESLDLIEGLELGGFEPSIAAVLGDEAGDRNDRAFRRAGAPWAGGQGIFRIDEGLPEVEGSRLRQFNLSPQTLPDLLEQNADFIELSIPLSELGDVYPGSTVWLAAIAVMNNVDESGFPISLLDDSFLGSRFEVEGGRALLEPVEIKLAPAPDTGALRVYWRRLENGTMRLWWSGEAGTLYHVERARGLDESFATIGERERLNADDSPILYYDLIEAPEAMSAFYRLKASPLQ